MNNVDGSLKPHVFSTAGTAYANGTKTPVTSNVKAKNVDSTSIITRHKNVPEGFVWQQVNFNIDSVRLMRRTAATVYAAHASTTYSTAYSASLAADKSTSDLVLGKPLSQHNLAMSDLSAASMSGNTLVGGYLECHVMLIGNFPGFSAFSLSDAINNIDSGLHIEYAFYTNGAYGAGRSTIVNENSNGQLIISDRLIIPNGVTLPGLLMSTADSNYTPSTAGDVGTAIIRWKGSPVKDTTNIVSNPNAFISPAYAGAGNFAGGSLLGRGPDPSTIVRDAASVGKDHYGKQYRHGNVSSAYNTPIGEYKMPDSAGSVSINPNATNKVAYNPGGTPVSKVIGTA